MYAELKISDIPANTNPRTNGLIQELEGQLVWLHTMTDHKDVGHLPYGAIRSEVYVSGSARLFVEVEGVLSPEADTIMCRRVVDGIISKYGVTFDGFSIHP